MKNLLVTMVFFVALSGVVTAHAESRYVIDHFKVMMRSGESSTNKIIRMLPSGHEVELLGSNSETGYSEVRLADGKTGYILTRQLMEEPSARDQLTVAQAKLKELQAEPELLGNKLLELQDEYGRLSKDHAQLQKVKAELEQELESIQRTAADAVRIAKERTELRKNLADLTRQMEELKMENQDLSNNEARDWFLVGAGVIIFGIILGLILPRLRVQRRTDNWGSL